ncbi:GntR family transcriptional regulator [Calorimonas adulescens]|uniref:GntR family transcriptional regulator n=1 Tax=Calorimonas adulescens TaxID=2606906 RepID=A0A5D8QD14_9THEO|nr:GntR family transcriptional regulator [Calorimonas adulescens]
MILKINGVIDLGLIQSDRRPLYEVALKKMEEMIRSGDWPPGYRLPSEAKLSEEFGISRMTLREAMRVLEEENLIVKQQGVGTFVKSRPVIKSGIEELYSVTKAIEREGMTAGTTDFSINVLPANEEEAKRLNIEKDSEIYRVDRVRTANGEPVVYCIDRIPVSILSDGLDSFPESLFGYLEKNFNIRIAYAISDIIPISYHPVASKKLGLGKNHALLLLEQVHYDQNNRAILYSSNFFKPDKFRFYVVRKRV